MDELIKNLTKELTKEVLKEVEAKLLLEVKRALYPRQIKGHEKAGELIGISSSAMVYRLNSGYYVENHHYSKKSDKIYVWNREALLESETKRGVQ